MEHLSGALEYTKWYSHEYIFSLTSIFEQTVNNLRYFLGSIQNEAGGSKQKPFIPATYSATANLV